MVYFKKTKKPAYVSRAPARFQKRWYVDASIPKAVPFIGGASFKAGSGSLSKRSINQIRNALLEKKNVYRTDTTAGLTHNTIYTNNLLGNIGIGTGDTSRISDKIHVKHIKLNMLFVRDQTDVNDAWIRCLIVKTRAEYHSGTNGFAATGLGSNEIFQAGTTRLLMSHIDTDVCTVLADKRIKMSPNNSTDKSSHYFECDFPNPFNMQYKTVTSNYGKDFNYYVVVIPFVSTGVSGTTVVGNLFPETLVEFTDGS